MTGPGDSPRRWLPAVLAVSLATNLLLAGALGAFVLERGGLPGRSDVRLERAALPDDGLRAAFRGELRTQRFDLRTRRRELRAARHALRNALDDPNTDPAALTLALERTRRASDALRADLHDALVRAHRTQQEARAASSSP